MKVRLLLLVTCGYVACGALLGAHTLSSDGPIHVVSGSDGASLVKAVSAVAMSAVGAPVAAIQQTTSVGVYTRAQAKRGEKLYLESCASCHLDDMSGSHTAPALADETFVRRYAGRSLADLYDRIKTTMPQGAAGTLSEQAYADILANILQANQFKAGTQELPPATTRLQPIIVQAPAEQ